MLFIHGSLATDEINERMNEWMNETCSHHLSIDTHSQIRTNEGGDKYSCHWLWHPDHYNLFSLTSQLVVIELYNGYNRMQWQWMMPKPDRKREEYNYEYEYTGIWQKKEDRIKTFILLVKQLLSKTETYINIDSFENVFQSNQATLYFNISFLSNKMNVKIHCKL